MARNQNHGRPPMLMDALARDVNIARARANGGPRRILPPLPPPPPGPAPDPAHVERGAYGEPAGGRDLDAWVANSAQQHLHRLAQSRKDDPSDVQVRLLTGIVEHHKAQEEFVADKSVETANTVREKLRDIICALHDAREQHALGAEDLATNIAMEHRARRQMQAINETGF